MAIADIQAGTIPEDLFLPVGAATRAEVIAGLTDELSVLDERLDQQERILGQIAGSHNRQQIAVQKVTRANEDLETALRTAEPIRQASWIATRIAVVAILLFLVQIVVNRYRYLQRMADFYHARGQAFRMLADAGPTAGGRAVERDRASTIWPPGYRPTQSTFGKSADVPTQQIMALVQSALKK